MTFDLPIQPNPYWLGTFHCLIGIIAADLARRKGLSFNWWLLWGLIGGTASLVFVIFSMSPRDRDSQE